MATIRWDGKRLALNGDDIGMMQWKSRKSVRRAVIGRTRVSCFPAWLFGLILPIAACIWFMMLASPLALCQQPVGAPPEIKLSVVVAPLYPMGTAAKAWGDALNELAAGAFEVKFYPGATLARRDPTEEFKSVQSGEIDIAVGSALQSSDAFAPLGVLALPWMAPSNAQLGAVVANGVVRSKLTTALDAAGVTLVALAPLRHRVLATQSRAIMSPDDLKDLRIRVTGPKLVTDTYIALHAKPTGLSLDDARNALATDSSMVRINRRLRSSLPVRGRLARVMSCNGVPSETRWYSLCESHFGKRGLSRCGQGCTSCAEGNRICTGVDARARGTRTNSRAMTCQSPG